MQRPPALGLAGMLSNDRRAVAVGAMSAATARRIPRVNSCAFA